MRVETASEYTYNYDDFNCGKFYYDLDGDGRLELFICLSYQRENLQYSFPYILDIKGDTVFSAYEFQPTCPTRFSNHITLLQGTDKTTISSSTRTTEGYIPRRANISISTKARSR